MHAATDTLTPFKSFGRHVPNPKKKKAISTDVRCLTSNLRKNAALNLRKNTGSNIDKALSISSPMKGEKNMHLESLIEAQSEKPATTLRVERLLREAEALSPEERLQFFPRWMEEQDVGTSVALFVTWMCTAQDDKLKKTLFVSWMHAESGNRKLLKEIAVKASAVLVTKGFMKPDYAEIERRIKAAVEKEDGRSTDEIAHAYKNYFRLPEKMVPLLKGLVQTAKENLRLKKKSRKKSATGRTRAGYNTSATERLLAGDLYSVDLPLPEIQAANIAPAPLAEVPSL